MLINTLKQIGYSTNNKQGNRVYNDDCMYKDIMKKLPFNMEEIRLFDSFAGIGALHQSLKELGIPTKLMGISEVDINAIISYAAVHIDNFKNIPFDYPSDNEMRKILIDRNIGYDFKKNKSKIPRLNKKKLKSCFKATMLINNLGDIGRLDYEKVPDFDLFNFSFPCTNISVAGKQEGMKKKDGSITNSGLYIYGIEVIKHKKPKYIMIENVKNLIGKKFIKDFYKIINQIEDLGYNCYYPTKEDRKGNKKPICLNAKDFGIPQNRERIFVICVRKDVDTYDFEFPIGKDYGIRLKDILEDVVDEKYYLSDKMIQGFKKHNINHTDKGTGFIWKTRDLYGLASCLRANAALSPTDNTICEEDLLNAYNGERMRNFIEYTKQGVEVRQATKKGYDIAKEGDTINLEQPNSKTRRGRVGKQVSQTLTCSCNQAVCLKENKINQIGILNIKGNEQVRRIYSQEGISSTLNTMQGGNRQLKILTHSKYIDKKYNDFITKDGYAPKMSNPYNSKEIRDNAPTLTAQGNSITKSGTALKLEQNYRLRRLTPTECWRLMGFRDEHINKAIELGISDSQLYKQAGNSIVVNVLYFIFKNLFRDYIK